MTEGADERKRKAEVMSMRMSRTLLLVVLTGATLVACGGGSAPPISPDAPAVAAEERGAAEVTEGFAIQSPIEGSTVAGPVTLRVATAPGIEIGEPGTGEMHLHVYVDGGEEIVCNEPVRDFDLAAGEHSLRVVLAQPNHDETEFEETVRVTVAGA